MKLTQAEFDAIIHAHRAWAFFEDAHSDPAQCDVIESEIEGLNTYNLETIPLYLSYRSLMKPLFHGVEHGHERKKR